MAATRPIQTGPSKTLVRRGNTPLQPSSKEQVQAGSMVNPLSKLVDKLKPHNGDTSPSQSSRNSSDSSKHSFLSRGHHAHRKSIPDEPSAKEEKLAKRQEERSHEQRLGRLEDLAQRHAAEPSAEMRRNFGMLAVNQVEQRDDAHRRRIQFQELTSEDADKAVYCEARVHIARHMSAKLVFLVLRQQMHTLQAVLKQSDTVSEHFVRWAEHIPAESVVLCKGTLQRPLEAVQATSIHSLELVVDSLHVVATLTKQLPFSVQQASLPRLDEEQRTLTDRTLLAVRLVHLRTPTAQAIFRIQSGVCNLFRMALDNQDFIEIHTPKLQGGATESGASVFSVDYFGRKAFLAQSPQLAKQMCIAADFGKVYEIGPVFRAENSNTHRHLTEYTGLDIEMAFEKDYHEAMWVIDAMLKTIFSGIYKRYEREINVLEQDFPHERLVWLEETLVLRFDDAIQLLIDSGWKDEHGDTPSKFEDMGTRDEIQLGKLIKKKYNTDYYILDKFPASARPFYTMLDKDDERYTNSFDIFVRGQEITTGGQRIHDSCVLEERIAAAGMQTQGMEDYLDGFRYAVPPHAGAGIGLERLVMLLLNLGNIRFASLFPRDPKSLPRPPPALRLRHPDASTLNPVWTKSGHTGEKQLQSLGDLIANYGDASNTSWLDDRYIVWRHESTGAAIGYVPVLKHAIIVGEPLCDPSQAPRVIPAFLQYLHQETSLTPIWMLVGEQVEKILGEEFGWSTLSCAAEERVDAMSNPAQHEQEVQRKIRHAEREGVTIIEVPANEEIPEDIKQKIEKRMEDWKANRHGRQIHLTELNPWRDAAHRRYMYALDAEGQVCALLVLATLSIQHGYQVKYSLDFPKSPGGAIEAINMKALQLAAKLGAETVTFGVEASPFRSGLNQHGMKMRLLERSFNTISKQFKLQQKSEFRRKLGAMDDPIYICYPKGKMGASGIRAIMRFLSDDPDDK